MDNKLFATGVSSMQKEKMNRTLIFVLNNIQTKGILKLLGSVAKVNRQKVTDAIDH
jgi:hypothetical protein